METENNTKQDCGCGTDCCTPKKSKLWMKIVFIVIVAAAIAIVTVKLISNNRNFPQPEPLFFDLESIGATGCNGTCFMGGTTTDS